MDAFEETADSQLAKKIFYSDLIEVIARHSSPKDIVTLAQLYPPRLKPLQRIFREIIIGRIDGWFRNYFKSNPGKYEEFVEAMIFEKAFVSGSFIIQMVLGEKWEGSDIDIFVPIPDSLTIRQRGPPSVNRLSEKYASLEFSDLFTLVEHVIFSDVDKEGFVPQHYTEPVDEQDLSDEGRLAGNIPVRYRKLFGEAWCIITLREYSLHKSREETLAKFQVIGLKNSTDILNFVNHAFDFDICKNTFQYVASSKPNNSTSCDMDGRPEMKLRLLKPMEIIDRVTGFKPSDGVRTSLARCKKYIARGFKFYDDIDNSTGARYSAFQRSKDRIQAKIGFNRLLATEQQTKLELATLSAEEQIEIRSE